MRRGAVAPFVALVFALGCAAYAYALIGLLAILAKQHAGVF